MSKDIKLSILMCSTNTRVSNFLQSIYKQLNSQLTAETELITIIDNKTQSIGEKRNNLIGMAKGEYVVFVDDDDTISDDYITQLLSSISDKPDVLNFRADISVNGAEYIPVSYSIYHQEGKRGGIYYRKPNHLMCWKRDIANKVKFEDISFGEDTIWANEVSKLVTSEIVIPNILYHYNYNENTSESLPFKS